jgi:hypothetical protein
MKEFTGTKGDWSVNNGAIISSVLVEKSKNNHVFNHENGELAQCWADYHDGSYISQKECHANARLMAAAPAMFEMLIKILSIEDAAFGLKSFDVARLKSEITSVISVV